MLRWDAKYEEKGKHGKYGHFWKGPYKIVACHGSDTFIIQSLHGEWVDRGLVNGRFLKHYVN